MKTFEQFQAGVRASERLICEADLYWRADRWGMIIDAKSDQIAFAQALIDPPEPTEKLLAAARRHAAMIEACRPLFKSNKSNPPEVGRIFRR